MTLKPSSLAEHTSTFTPGPWEYDGVRVDATAHRKVTTVTDKDGNAKPYTEGLIALVYSCGPYQTHQGNGRLIAAAPAMYEALKAYLAWGAMTGSDRDLFDEKFRAALALVDGGAK